MKRYTRTVTSAARYRWVLLFEMQSLHQVSSLNETARPVAPLAR